MLIGYFINDNLISIIVQVIISVVIYVVLLFGMKDKLLLEEIRKIKKKIISEKIKNEQ